MKFTKEEKARLKALLLKADRTDGENTELESLKALAVKAEYRYDEKSGDEIADEPMTPEDVKTLVTEGVSGVMTDLGLDADTVAKIKASIEKGGEVVTAESIKSAIKDAVGGQVDTKQLSALIESKLPKNAVTMDSVKSLFDDFKKEFAENTRRQSKMLFGSEGHAPIESRGGNLSVAQKQLLNICLMQAPEEALRNSDGGRGIARPKSMNDGIGSDILREAEFAGVKYLNGLRKKALTTGGTGTGAEFIPTDLSSDLQARMYLASELATTFIANEVQMPTNPFAFPLSTTRPTFRKGSENPGSDPDDSDAGTGDITLTAAKLIGICNYSYEADEDSIIAILPFLQDQMGQAAADALEQAIVNGDTTATHMDSDTHAVGATAAQKLFKGLRKLSLIGTAVDSSSVAVDFSTGGVSAANIRALRKKMLRWGVKPSDLRLIVGVNGYNDIVGLDETMTAEKVGPNAARILTGIATQIFGIPIIVSSAVREDLNATGVYDGSTTTKGSMHLVHLPSWLMGVRRGFLVETEVDRKQQVNSVIGSFRRAFQPIETPSLTMPIVATGYNWTA